MAPAVLLGPSRVEATTSSDTIMFKNLRMFMMKIPLYKKNWVIEICDGDLLFAQ
jgi:hypothetical protein